MGAWLRKAFPASALPAAGWSSLPPELADLVLRRLSSLADRVRFASVCRDWLRAATQYSAPTLPRPLPWLNFHDGSFLSLPDGERHHSFHFRRHAVCAGSFGSWLLFEEEAAGCKPSRRHFLKHPLLGTTKRLPGRCHEPVDLLNPEDGSHAGSARSSSTKFSISKVIVCSGDLIVAKVNYLRRRPCAVVCCRPGVSPSWSTGMCNGHWYHDMAFYKGKLYTVTEEGHLFVHEVIDNGGEPRVSLIGQVIQAPPPQKYAQLDGCYAALDRVMTCYLVISCDNKLLMVRLMLRWTIPFDQYGPAGDRTKRMRMQVFEADLETSRWVEVKSLGDQVLFVSSCSSKAIKASSHAHCGYLRWNSIYFVDDGLMFSQIWPNSMPRTCGVYDMSSDTVRSISLGGVRINDQSKASWFFP